MFDGTHNFFVESVLANYEEYVQERQTPRTGKSNDLRLAVNAVTSLYHMREHMPPSYTKTRCDLATTCLDYDLLGDIANACKHGVLDSNRRVPLVASADALSEVVVITEYEDDQGPFHMSTKTIEVSLADGTTRELGEVLHNVLNMWIGELHDLGILPMTQRQPPSAPPLSRQNANGAATLALTLRQGERFTQKVILKKYDYKRGEALPVDLTGFSAQLQIYHPTA